MLRRAPDGPLGLYHKQQGNYADTSQISSYTKAKTAEKKKLQVSKIPLSNEDQFQTAIAELNPWERNKAIKARREQKQAAEAAVLKVAEAAKLAAEEEKKNKLKQRWQPTPDSSHDHHLSDAQVQNNKTKRRSSVHTTQGRARTVADVRHADQSSRHHESTGVSVSEQLAKLTSASAAEDYMTRGNLNIGTYVEGKHHTHSHARHVLHRQM